MCTRCSQHTWPGAGGGHPDTTSNHVMVTQWHWQQQSHLQLYHWNQVGLFICNFIVFTYICAHELTNLPYCTHSLTDAHRCSGILRHMHTLGIFFFFLCVPSHARFSVRWVRRSPQSAAVSQPVPKASCGPPLDWAMSGVSSHRRWGRIAGCGWGFEDPCHMDIRLSGKFSVCGGGRRIQFSV